jgi:hypothetical protein
LTGLAKTSIIPILESHGQARPLTARIRHEPDKG